MEEVVHLSRLSEPETRTVVEGLLGGALLPGEAHYLAAACEGNPLGVRMAGGCTVAGVCSALSLMTNLRETNQANVAGEYTILLNICIACSLATV